MLFTTPPACVLAGVMLGTLVGQSEWAMRGLDPIFQVLRTIVDRSLRLRELEEENRRLAATSALSPVKRIITASEPMLKVCRDVGVKCCGGT